jgi:hypothetical protein
MRSGRCLGVRRGPEVSGDVGQDLIAKSSAFCDSESECRQAHMRSPVTSSRYTTLAEPSVPVPRTGASLVRPLRPARDGFEATGALVAQNRSLIRRSRCS